MYLKMFSFGYVLINTILRVLKITCVVFSEYVFFRFPGTRWRQRDILPVQAYLPGGTVRPSNVLQGHHIRLFVPQHDHQAGLHLPRPHELDDTQRSQRHVSIWDDQRIRQFLHILNFTRTEITEGTVSDKREIGEFVRFQSLMIWHAHHPNYKI